MKKLIYIVAIVLVSTTGFSQKIKLKKGEITVDEVAWLKYDGCGTFDSTCSLINHDGNEIMFLKQHSIPGEAPITSSNPKGNLAYYELKFLGLNASAEFEHVSQKRILEMIYKAGLVAGDGTLDEEKVALFVEKHGSPVSARLNRGNNNTIIINERENDGRPKINVNIGR